MSALWPGCSLPKPEDFMETEESIDSMTIERLRLLAGELGIVVSDNPSEEVLKVRLKASIFS